VATEITTETAVAKKHFGDILGTPTKMQEIIWKMSQKL